MNLSTMIDIASLAALVSFIFLAFIAVSSLKKINEFLSGLNPKIDKISNDISEIKDKSIETMANADDTSKSITSLVSSIESNVNEIGGVIEPYKRLANDVYSKIYKPVNNTAVFVTAISKALNAFTDRLKR